jgi:NhaA family Na+:H+ antiporter
MPSALPRRAGAALAEFFKLEAAGGLLLIGAALLALVMANSPLDEVYDAVLSLPVEIRIGALQLAKPLLLWINDGLMAVFFLLVALEIKREAVQGELSSGAQRVLPLACALGGVLVPALIYAWINADDATALRGWAIPAATDIAFALGMLSLLGSRVPAGIRILLAAIAVLDDLAAIIIIALFYSGELSSAALIGAGIALLGLIVLNRLHVTRTSAYIVLGIVMWVCVLKSGVHATLAGVATGLLIPLRGRDDDAPSPLETLEHDLHPWVAFAILPLFAFANAGLSLGGAGWQALLAPVPVGVALGLLLGKPIGVFGAAAVAIGIGVAARPAQVGWGALFGMAVLCGIGFTMSLFIASLAFAQDAAAYAESSRFGVLAGSAIAAAIGLLVLHLTLPRNVVRS